MGLADTPFDLNGVALKTFNQSRGFALKPQAPELKRYGSK